MSIRKSKGAEILPDANPDTDCGPDGDLLKTTEAAVTEVQNLDDGDDDHHHNLNRGELHADHNDAGSALGHWLPERMGWTKLLERIALAIERPANRLIGTPQLNPFYHTGTIAILLLIVVGLTGFYLFLFYQYGFDASYNAVQTRIEDPFIARTIRAIHRYASGALVITTLLHAFRTLFMERFHGPRWLAWITGVIITGMLWVAGVTGYWLVWDTRAQLINDGFVNFLEALTPFVVPYLLMLRNAEITGGSWVFFLVIFAVHILLTLVSAFFFWLHIKRLKRPRWLPPVYWVVGVGIVVLLVALIFPAGMLPQGNIYRLPGNVTIDPLFLFYFPTIGNPAAGWLLWGGLLAFTLLFAALPWLNFRHKVKPPNEQQAAAGNYGKPLVNVIKDNCTGCTVCAVDCPYNAIQMVERHDGKIHKYIAIEDPGLCVSCGICIGSCDVDAVTMGNVPLEMFWLDIQAQMTLAKIKNPTDPLKLVFTCERHASQGARPYLQNTAEIPQGEQFAFISLPCVGILPPDLLTRALDNGAAEIRVVGCPADDCTNREGNFWAEQRLTRERVPRLKRNFANAPISAFWLPPDDFSQALKPIITAGSPTAEDGQSIDFLEQRRIFKPLHWRNYVMAFFLLALVMVVQVLLTDLPFKSYPGIAAANQVVIADLGASIGRSSYMSTVLGPELKLVMEIDGLIEIDQPIATSDLMNKDPYPYYYQHDLAPGNHEIKLILRDPLSQISFVFYDQTVTIAEHEILIIP